MQTAMAAEAHDSVMDSRTRNALFEQCFDDRLI
jgi:hypothetical protein